jgi:alpha-galactosidase
MLAARRAVRLLLLTAAGPASALDNGVGLTPAMGYNTWNDFRCGSDLNASAVRSIADAMVSWGLAAKGYKYLNIDDCWTESQLSADGRLVELSAAFPEGVGALASYVHSKGLKFGLYADRGWKTCAFGPGSGGNERLHASQLAEWGVDYLKHDSCWASSEPEKAFRAYGIMRDALNATGRPILYSLCGWNAWYAPMGQSLANSWRIAPDCDEWANIYIAIRTNEQLSAHASPGSFNDPDMLLGSNPDAPASLTPTQVQAQFSMWAVMAAPLLIGSRLLSMPESDLATYSNEEVIAVNQDPLGRQGAVIWSNCPAFEVRIEARRCMNRVAIVEYLPRV